MTRDFKVLPVWKQAFDFSIYIYKITQTFPDDEKFGLGLQLRRAATSIFANIAEGCGRESKLDFRRFLFVALGSAKECESFVLFSKELNYISKQDSQNLCSEIDLISKQLNTFIQLLLLDHKKLKVKGQELKVTG